ncbi:ankyrin repeat domain-containing protein, partial [Morganella morganii]|uniref:ankyrin repeat domain-containing protein n=1 Tax=Morganella morganii TaxID=582 RepID=UPI0013D10368
RIKSSIALAGIHGSRGRELWLDNTENDLNQGDDHGFSPLHWACREGRSAVVEMLIMRGAEF